MIGNIQSLILAKHNLTYSEKYAAHYIIKALTWAACLTLISAVGRFIAKRFKKKISMKANPLLGSTYHSLDDFEQDIPYRELKKYLKRRNSSQPIFIQLVILLSSIGYFLSYLVYGMIPAILSAFNIISLFTSFLILVLMSIITGLIMIKITCPSEVKPLIKARVKRKPHSLLRKFYFQALCLYRLHYFAFKSFVLFLLCYSAFLPLITANSCMAYYTPEYGSSFDAYTISTSLSRLFTIEKKCPTGRICHIYSTLPEDPSTSIILNVQTGSDLSQIQVLYTKENAANNGKADSQPLNKTPKSYFLEIEWKAQRYVHSVYLDELEPNTLYYTQIFYENKFLGDARFKTLPSSKMETNITVVTGGDSGGTEKSTQFIQNIASYDPDVIVIGGDIVYDNGNINCYYCWDYYLDQFDILNKRLGRVIPLVLAVGNHDVGMNSFQFRNVEKDKNLLFLFFPQHTKTTGSGQEIPDPHERMSYFSHRLGNTLHVTLDSGYLTKYSGNQTEWLIEVSQKYHTAAKIATYHTPIFPGCFFNPSKYGVDSRFTSWIPIFEKYNFMGVFENHVHLFKRTFPLKFTKQIQSPGVVYFGDGAWGVNVNDCYAEDPNPNITGLFEKLGSINHVWIVKITPQTLEYQAINLNGEIIDQYNQSISDYTSKTSPKSSKVSLKEHLKRKEIDI